jgi:predicted DCC family thiol-disulfide oxidoreductase YuxK
MYFSLIYHLVSSFYMTEPIFLYDGNCGFCTYWVSYWRQLTSGVDYATLESKQKHFEKNIGATYFDSVHLVRIDGTITSGGEAVVELLSYAPSREYPLWMYRHLPGFAPLSEWIYKKLSSCRDCGASITALLWGSPARPPLFTWDLLPFSTMATHAVRLSLVFLLLDSSWSLLSLSRATDQDIFLIIAITQLFLTPFLLLPRTFRNLALVLLFLTQLLLLPQAFRFSSLFILFLLLSFLDLGGLATRKQD